MGFLAPLFLVVGLAALVPLFLHLFHRQEARRMAFPALRYLMRTEKEHARRIRLRQLLLLLLRIGAIVLLVTAGARAFLSGPGRAHPPTALAIVLDNSASSGLVLDDERVLDRLVGAALRSVAAASERDEVWVLRAGEPWDLALPGSPAQAEARIRDTEPGEGGGDLDATLRRAVALVESSELATREIHLFSDLQASGFPDSMASSISDGLPVLALAPDWDVPVNHAVGQILVGGGLPPIVGQRTQVAADLIGPEAAIGDSVPVRLFVNGRIVGATVAPLGSTVVFPLGPLAEGPVDGHVEIDPDALRVDDRRHFAFQSSPPPAVGVTGPGGEFLSSALDVLGESGRLRAGRPADVIFAIDGDGLSPVASGMHIVIPSGDPATLPALNRRLASVGIPWQYAPASVEGEMRVTRNTLPHDLSEIRVSRRFDLAAGGSAASGVTLVEVGPESPWVVTGTASTGRYLLFGSPIDLESSNLAVSSVLLPLLEWTVSRWFHDDEWTREILVGQAIEVPEGTTATADPTGALLPDRSEGLPLIARTAGIYTVTSAGNVSGRIAANVDVAESDLTPIDPIGLGSLLGPGFELVDGTSAWQNAIFRNRQGPEIWWPLVFAALVFLILESIVAGSGRRQRAPRRSTEGIPASAPVVPAPKPADLSVRT